MKKAARLTLAATILSTVALAGPAQAIVTNTDGVGGNASLALVVYDAVLGTASNAVAYVQDLGISYDQWESTYAPMSTYNFATSANWGSFLGAIQAADPAYQANLRYQVLSWNNSPASLNSLTSDGSELGNASISNFNLTRILSPLQSFYISLNSHGIPAGGSLITDPSMGTAYPLNLGSIGQRIGFFTSALGATIGSQVPLNNYLQDPDGSNNAPAISTTYGYIKLGLDGQLSYSISPVPEPESWVMFAAGLVGLGLFARRRNQRNANAAA